MDKLICRLHSFVPLGEMNGFYIFYYPPHQRFYQKKYKKVPGSFMGGVVLGFSVVYFFGKSSPAIFLPASVAIIVMFLIAVLIALLFWFLLLRQWVHLYPVELSLVELTDLIKRNISDRLGAIAGVVLYFLFLAMGFKAITAELVSLLAAPLSGVIAMGVLVGLFPHIIFVAWISFHRVILVWRVRVKSFTGMRNN